MILKWEGSKSVTGKRERQEGGRRITRRVRGGVCARQISPQLAYLWVKLPPHEGNVKKNANIWGCLADLQPSKERHLSFVLLPVTASCIFLLTAATEKTLMWVYLFHISHCTGTVKHKEVKIRLLFTTSDERWGQPDYYGMVVCPCLCLCQADSEDKITKWNLFRTYSSISYVFNLLSCKTRLYIHIYCIYVCLPWSLYITLTDLFNQNIYILPLKSTFDFEVHIWLQYLFLYN